MLIKKILPIISVLLASLSVYAQETTSEIVGTVTDGKTPLTGATVTALNVSTGTKSTTTTRKEGRYNLPNLRVGGPYAITVSYVGFQQATRDSVFLSLGQDFKADFNLLSSSASLEAVTVTSVRQNNTFNSSRTGAQEVISRTQIERLPTINRSLQDFTRLEPSSNGLNIGGRSSQYNNLTIDGANFNNSFGLSGTLGGQTGSQPISLEAIEQIQVSVAPYDVRQGGFSGAGINTVTRSGTNQFRGSVYGYIKGPGTQGYNVENTTLPKSSFNYNIKGFTIGGPIVQNKLFFFLSAEQVRQNAPATNILPSDASHSPGGNYSQANADSLNALRSFLMQKLNYDPGAYTGYNFQTKSDKITAKLDWNIGRGSTLTLKYNYLKSSADQFASNSRPGSGFGTVTGGQPGTTSMPFYSSGYVINNNFNIVIAELNTTGRKSSNKLQAGYTALRDFRSPHSPSPTFPLVDILNGTGQIYTTFGYEPFTYNNVLNTDVYQLSDIYTMYRGTHEITGGFQGYYRKYQNAFAPGYQGSYQFSSLSDFYNSVNTGAANARNFYLQYSALPKGEFPWAYAGSTELGFFAQDRWRPTSNFTLTYGLRADFTIYKQSFTDNPSFDALQFANGATYNIGKAPRTTPLISPRLGFNWDVKGNKSLQLRGGIGLFSGPPPFVWISNQASNNGTQFGSSTVPNVPFNVNPVRPTSGVPNSSYSVALVSNNFKYPTVLKSSLAVDKKLPGDYIVTLEGTYNKDINAVYYSNINLNESNAYPINNGADQRLRYLAGPNTNKYYYAGTSTANPNIGTGILMSNTNKGYGYTATLRVQKTFKNLYASIAYTRSDSRNTAEFGSTASSLWSARPVYQDPNAANLAYSAFYQPHRVVGFASYRFTYAKHFATSIGAIFEAAPAGATSYVYNGDLNGDNNSGNDLIYIPKSANDINLVKVGSGGLGTGASTDPRSGTLGTGAASKPENSQIWNQLNNFISQDHYLAFHRGQYSKANAVVFPFYKRLDLNITEDISLKTGKERHTLRFTMDLINAGNFFNRNWGIVKTTNITNFLRYEGMGADGKTPSFSFPYLDPTNQVPLTNSYTNNTSILSRWQMQFGFKYLFN